LAATFIVIIIIFFFCSTEGQEGGTDAYFQ
jgi:hypothetical protein